MKILHVVEGLEKASGITTFVENIVVELCTLGHEIDIVTKDGCCGNRKEIVKKYDIVHIHDLWTPWLHGWAKAVRKAGVKLVWSPHGTLTPWALRYKGFKKKIAWLLYQKRDLESADAIHVTVSSEEEDVRRVGLKNRIIVAPLGVRLCAGVAHGRDGNLLFVSRIHPKKGLPNLIRALEIMNKMYPPAKSNLLSSQWHLRVVGPDEVGHTAELKTLAKKVGVADRIDFVGSKYGEELEQEYLNADCFILPSFSENFGSVVVEAMAAGLPVIASKGTPWQELEERKCGWWVENDPESLARTIAEMMSLSDAERRAMGARGRQLVEEKYQWSVIGKKIAASYEGILGRVANIK